MKALGKLSIVAGALLLVGLWALPARADHQQRGGPGQVHHHFVGGGGHGHPHFYGPSRHGGFGAPSHCGRYQPSFGGPSFGGPSFGGPGYYGRPGGNLGLYLPRFGLRLNF